MQAHPQKFWFGENLAEILEKWGKIRGNLGKNGAQHALV